MNIGLGRGLPEEDGSEQIRIVQSLSFHARPRNPVENMLENKNDLLISVCQLRPPLILDEQFLLCFTNMHHVWGLGYSMIIQTDNRCTIAQSLNGIAKLTCSWKVCSYQRCEH